MGEKIREHVQERRSPDLNIGFVEEDRELGTAGALSLLSPRPKTSFLVMNADLLTTLDFKAFARFHKKEANDFSVCVRRIKKIIPYGVITLDSDNKAVASVVEKPEYGFLVNAGIYMLEPKIIDLIPQNTFFDMVSLMRKAMATGCKVGAFPILEYWRDIGQHSEMQLAAREWEQLKNKGGLETVPSDSAAEEERS